ncbi:MAG: J domain-containing protein [Flavobacteriales bacterium]
MSKGELVKKNSEEDKFRKDQKKYADALKRLLKTEKELEKERARLDSRMEKLVNACQPVLDEIFALKIEIIHLLASAATSEKSVGLQRDYYYKIIDLINEVLQAPHSLSHAVCESLIETRESALEHIEELSKALKDEEKLKMNLSAEEQMDMVLEMLDEAEMACEMHGVHVDFSDADLSLHPKDFEEYIREKIKDAFQQKEEQSYKEEKQSHDFLKFAEKEKVAATPELTSLYKKLVKLIHPDRERDEKIRAQKEEAMKKLTVAYEKRDLMELMRLEAEWGSASELSDFKSNPIEIKNHIGLLLKKIKALKLSKGNLIHDAKYFKLRYIGVTYYGVYDASPKEVQRSLESQRDGLDEVLRMLGNPKSRKRAFKML